MNADILICRRCQQPLKIVCDEHGVDCVPDRRLEATVPVPVTTSRPLRGKRAMIVDQVARGRVTGPAIADALGITLAHVQVEVSHLMKSGHLSRVARGVYALGARGTSE